MKTEAATAAKMVPGLEKWIIGSVSFGLGPKLASASVNNDVIFRLPVFARDLTLTIEKV